MGRSFHNAETATEMTADQARQRELAELQERLDYRFADQERLERALRHASTGNENRANYERLEFLGDAILNFLVAERLFVHQDEVAVGQLTELRARLVARQPLATIAGRLGLGPLLEGGRGLRARDRASPRILADLVEAVLAAIYLDGGMTEAARFVDREILPLLDDALCRPSPTRDAKSRLLHLAQRRGLGQPRYEILSEEGPAHERLFEVGVYLADRQLAAATGRTRQLAEKAAAARALAELADSETGA